jgi:hypothetical protein
MKYFKDVQNLQELKAEYKRLVKIHHPDKGGDLQTMKDINAEYDKMLETQAFGKDNKPFTDQELKDNKVYRDILEQTVILEGIEIELAGSWLWFTGQTYPHKETLKKAGCRFSKNKVAWYWHPEGYVKKCKKVFSLEEIRFMHGSKKVETVTQEKLF